MQRCGEQPGHVGQQGERLQQVARHHRDVHVEFERARQTADGDRGIVADHLRGHLGDRFGDHRVDLARHDRDARLQIGQVQFAQSGQRTRAHPADVVGDLGQRHRDGLERTGGLDQAVAGGLSLERVFGRAQFGQPGLGDKHVDHLGAEPVGRVEAGADGGAADREFAEPRQRGPAPVRCRPRSGGRTRRTPGRGSPGRRPSGGCGRILTTVRHCTALATSDSCSTSSAGISWRTAASVAAMCVEVGKVSLDDCDMLTSSLGCTVTPLRAQIDAITSLAFMLELVPEPVWNTSMGNWSSCRPSAISPAAAMIASAFSAGSRLEVLVHLRAGRLQQGHGPDLVAVQAAERDREVLHGPLGLRPPQGVGRHPDLAHGVVLDPVLAVVRKHREGSWYEPFSGKGIGGGGVPGEVHRGVLVEFGQPVVGLDDPHGAGLRAHDDRLRGGSRRRSNARL